MLNRGFTLIELIVVFSTIAFLSTVGIVSYVSYSQSQSVEAEVQKLITTITLAKSRAASQVKPPVCVGQLDGYSVKIENANQYSINVVCEGISYPLQTITLPNNIKFTDDSLSKTVFFAVITGSVSGDGNFAIKGYNQDKCITIDSVGITEQLSSSCPTPTPTLTPTPTPTLTPTPTFTPTPTPTLTFKRVFVTSEKYTGNLGGLTGGDNKCQSVADGPSSLVKDRTWKAWLSTNFVLARDRIYPSGTENTEYRLVDHTTVVANDRNDLISGDIDNPINKNENNGTVSDDGVWTGTRSNGAYYFDGDFRTCDSWTGTNNGAVGSTGSTSSTWTDSTLSACASAVWRLYCFEQ